MDLRSVFCSPLIIKEDQIRQGDGIFFLTLPRSSVNMPNCFGVSGSKEKYGFINFNLKKFLKVDKNNVLCFSPQLRDHSFFFKLIPSFIRQHKKRCPLLVNEVKVVIQ